MYLYETLDWIGLHWTETKLFSDSTVQFFFFWMNLFYACAKSIAYLCAENFWVYFRARKMYIHKPKWTVIIRTAFAHLFFMYQKSYFIFLCRFLKYWYKTDFLKPLLNFSNASRTIIEFLKDFILESLALLLSHVTMFWHNTNKFAASNSERKERNLPKVKVYFILK